MENFGVWNDVFAQIKQEISNLHRLIEYSRSLNETVQTREPTQIELMALAGILHSFYMGFENIFKRIATEIDGKFNKTDSWHIDLLESMVESTDKRGPVLSSEVKRRLRFYLGFRHVFRSHYSYDLNWSKMKNLVLESEEILRLVENELNAFMSSNS
jgi:hypothetical protein